MSEQTSLVAVEIESEPTLFPQFSPTRFEGKKGVDRGNEFDLNQGVAGGGGGGGLPLWNRKQKKTTILPFHRLQTVRIFVYSRMYEQ